VVYGAEVRHVALYCRISVDRHGRREGVDAQERWGRAYAEKTWPGVPVVVYSDNDISATGDAHRPEFERFRADVAAGRVAHVWAVEQSRLTRGEVAWFELAAELDAAGIPELHTDRDGVVRVQDAVAGIKAVLNAYEVRRLTQRIRDRIAENAALGRPPAAPTFGYRHGVDEDGGKTLHQHPEEAAAVKEAAARILAGWSQTNVAREMTKQGFTGRRGGPLTPGKIYKILTNPTVAGLRVHRGKVTKGIWEPILDGETWRAVRRKLDSPRVVQRADGKTHQITPAGLSPKNGRKYLLTGGLAVCGLCGTPLVGTRKMDTKTRKFRPEMLCSTVRGGCGRLSILLEPTEEHVVGELKRVLDTPEFREALTSGDEHAEHREATLRKLEAIEQQREELAQMWGAGKLSAGEWQAAREQILEREARARAELADIPPPLHADLEGVGEAWPAMTLDERREILRLIIERITIHPAKPGVRPFDPGRIEIKWWA